MWWRPSFIHPHPHTQTHCIDTFPQVQTTLSLTHSHKFIKQWTGGKLYMFTQAKRTLSFAHLRYMDWVWRMMFGDFPQRKTTLFWEIFKNKKRTVFFTCNIMHVSREAGGIRTDIWLTFWRNSPNGWRRLFVVDWWIALNDLALWLSLALFFLDAGGLLLAEQYIYVYISRTTTLAFLSAAAGRQCRHLPRQALPR